MAVLSPPLPKERGLGQPPATGGFAWDLVLLVVGSLALAAPFVLLHHVNTLDGPGHLLGGEVLGKLRGTAVVKHYYDISFSWVPNILMQYLLAALTAFLSPTWAEKVLVVGYVVGFPLAFRYAVRSVDRSAGWLALGALPLTVSRSLLEGFYAFDYGMISAMLAIGLTLRARGRWNAWNTTGLAALLVVTYVSHPVPLVMALAVMAILVIADVVNGFRTSVPDQSNLAGELRKRALAPAIAAVPAVLMTAGFVLAGNAGGLFVKFSSVPSLVGGLFSLGLPVVSYTNLEYVASVLTVLVLVALAFFAVRALRRTKVPTLTVALCVAFGISVLLYFVIPNGLGAATVLSPRLALFVPLTLILLCGSVRLAPRVWKGAGLCFLLAAVVLTCVRLPTQLRYDRLVSQFLTVERVIPEGATLLEVRYRSYGSLDPLPHEASRVAADRSDVDLLNLEGGIVNFQENFKPSDKRLSRYLKNGHVNLDEYQSAGGRVDYVLVVGEGRHNPKFGPAPGPAFEPQLHRDFVRVMVTSGGLVQIYRHR